MNGLSTMFANATRWVAAVALVATYLFGAVALVSGMTGTAEAKKKVNTSNQKPSNQQNFSKTRGNHGHHGHHGHRHRGPGGGGFGIGGFGLGDGINIYIGR
jgi:hypothetical protein